MVDEEFVRRRTVEVALETGHGKDPADHPP